jgi:heavy metal translocating P-type ATPase
VTERAAPRAAWLSREAVIAAIALGGIVLHLVLRASGVPTARAQLPLFLVLALGGLPLVAWLMLRLLRLQFGSDLLAGISTVSAVLLGEYLAGALVVLMLSGGEALERYASGRASSVLAALARRMPSAAHRRGPAGVEDVAVESIRAGDTVVVFPHEICPVDGVVVEGRGVMDESYLTGEPFMMAKTPGTTVVSGAINGPDLLAIEATRPASDSRYARIMQVMRETEARRPPLRRLGDTLGAWYTPIALLVAGGAWGLTSDPIRFLAVLVVATPCPLLIGIPVAMIGSVSLAASRSIVIRDPAVLEHVDRCRAIVLDKTGTLTYGQPALTEELVAGTESRDRLLQLVASVERYSKHPLAAAILHSAEERGLPLLDAAHVSEPPGRGLSGRVDGTVVEIAGRRRLRDLGLGDRLPPVQSGLECQVLIDGRYAATYRFHDAPRPDSRQFVRHLGREHGIERVLLVTGDRAEEARYLADLVGITEVHASKAPEEKVEITLALVKERPTLFVGDGINDAPAMRAATVGVAFGHAAEVTTEAAGAVILEPTLRRVDELMHIGRRMRRIALQSAVGGMALSVVGMFFAAGGLLPPVAGAVAQELIDLAAVLNALRAAVPGGPISDY